MKQAIVLLALMLLSIAAVAGYDTEYWTYHADMDGKGKKYGELFISEHEIYVNGYSLQKYAWYTMIDYVDNDNIYCLSTRRTGYQDEKFGKGAWGYDLDIDSDYQGKVGTIMIVPSQHVSCWNVNGEANQGHMTRWNEDRYIMEI